jgi:hypothetical protein
VKIIPVKTNMRRSLDLPIMRLEGDELSHVLDQLRLFDLLRAAAVCQSWRDAVRGLWAVSEVSPAMVAQAQIEELQPIMTAHSTHLLLAEACLTKLKILGDQARRAPYTFTQRLVNAGHCHTVVLLMMTHLSSIDVQSAGLKILAGIGHLDEHDSGERAHCIVLHAGGAVAIVRAVEQHPKLRRAAPYPLLLMTVVSPVDGPRLVAEAGAARILLADPTNDWARSLITKFAADPDASRILGNAIGNGEIFAAALVACLDSEQQGMAFSNVARWVVELCDAFSELVKQNHVQVAAVAEAILPVIPIAMDRFLHARPRSLGAGNKNATRMSLGGLSARLGGPSYGGMPVSVLQLEA